MFGNNDTVGVLGHDSIIHRIRGLRDFGIQISATEILAMKPADRPQDLRYARSQGYIIVDPPFTDQELDPKGAGLLGTVSLDLAMGSKFCIHTNPQTHPVANGGMVQDLVVDIMDPETIRQVEEHDYLCELADGQKFALCPGDLVKAYTNRHFFMPYNIMGLVVGRSKVGRFGVTSTVDAPKIDPGFSGRIVLELAHHGRYRFALYDGLAIAQIFFLTVEGFITQRYDETHDTHGRNENIHYAIAPTSFMQERVVLRRGVLPVKGEE